ncbi:ribosome-inactivating family protein [Microbulbifer sp. ZKSA002]|uniref:ribosome-inactivating family protein n=1 Tax=Microbulbifer sp. ZKSA002 TaxID=3243388 RepID=UPI00403A25E6
MENLYTVRLEKRYYLSDLGKMLYALKIKAKRKIPVIYIDLVIMGGDRIRFYMRPRDLYLVGFKAPQNPPYYTEDCDINMEQGHRFFSDTGDYHTLMFESVDKLNVYGFSSYFYHLYNYAEQDNQKNNVLKAFGIVCALISESIRFYKKIAYKIIHKKFFNDPINKTKLDPLSENMLNPQDIVKLAKQWKRLSETSSPYVTCKHYDSL